MAVAVPNPTTEVIAKIREEAFVEQIRVALPGNITPDRFIRVAATGLMQNPDLAKSDRPSLLHSLIRCAQDGLLPDGKEAALVLFGGKVSYLPMVGGLRKVAAKSGLSLSAYVVFEHDTFSYELGMEPIVVHRPPSLSEDRGRPIGAYAVGTDREGNRYLEVMSHAEIEKVRAVSRASGKGPWSQWWEEMARKTVARRLFKQLPIDDLDEQSTRIVEAGDSEFEFRHPEWTPDEAAASRGVGDGFVPPPDDQFVEPLEGEYDLPGMDIGNVAGEPDQGSFFQNKAAEAQRRRPNPETGE